MADEPNPTDLVFMTNSKLPGRKEGEDARSRVVYSSFKKIWEPKGWKLDTKTQPSVTGSRETAADTGKSGSSKQ